MSKKKTGKREARVKANKTTKPPGAVELSEHQLDQVAGGLDSFAAIKGEAGSKEHKKEIEFVSYSFGIEEAPPGGLKSP